MTAEVASARRGLILMFVVFLLLPLWAIIDAAVRPGSAWELARQSKAVWLVLLIVFLFIEPVGNHPFFQIVYLTAIRSRVASAEPR